MKPLNIISLLFSTSAGLVHALPNSNISDLDPNDINTATTVNHQILRTNILRDQLNRIAITLDDINAPEHIQKADTLRAKIEITLGGPQLQVHPAVKKKTRTLKPGKKPKAIPAKIGKADFDQTVAGLLESYVQEKALLLGYAQKLKSGIHKDERAAMDIIQRIEGSLDLTVEGSKRRKIYGPSAQKEL